MIGIVLRELGYMVWTTNRPCAIDLTVDGGGMIVAINLGRFPKGAAKLIEKIEGSCMKIEIQNVFERSTDLCAVYWTPSGAQQGSIQGAKYVEEESERTAEAVRRWMVEAERRVDRNSTIFVVILMLG